MIEYRDRITRDMLQAEPNVLFVFGDNFARVGLGGQAREMRGEPNAVGVPTKRKPSMTEDSFFTDEDYAEWVCKVGVDLWRLLEHKGLIVWPSAGIGTGYAQLPERAPLIWDTIERLREILERLRGDPQ